VDADGDRVRHPIDAGGFDDGPATVAGTNTYPWRSVRVLAGFGCEQTADDLVDMDRQRVRSGL
jgi:hypothetical protein